MSDGLTGEVTGVVKTWKLFGKGRRYSEVTLPYKLASELFMPVRYNALTGKGEQRGSDRGHLRKLKAAIENGEYTPTPVSVGLSKKHRGEAKFDRLKNGDEVFKLTVSSNDPLPLTDGGHRLEAVGAILKDLRNRLNMATDEQEKVRLMADIDELLALPITATVYLDGDTQRDFVNLQAGRSVDAAHLFSLKVQQKVLAEPEFKLAMQVAKLLHKADGSPFQNLIRFDSRGELPLPISTLCSKGASDLGTSLIGLAKVGLAAAKPMDADTLAKCVLDAYAALRDHAPEVIASGKVLTPLGNGGTKGSATMTIGLGILLAYRLGQEDQSADYAALVKGLAVLAKQHLNQQVDGGFSGSVKRRLMGVAARMWFANDQSEKHDDVPLSLLRTLSASTYDADKLPKEKKSKPTEKAPQPPPKKARTKKTKPAPDMSATPASSKPLPAGAFDEDKKGAWDEGDEPQG